MAQKGQSQGQGHDDCLFWLSGYCASRICTRRTQNHQRVLFISSPSPPWYSTAQETRSVGVTQLAAESRQRTGPFFIPDSTFLVEIRNSSGSPGSLLRRPCSLWFLGLHKGQKLDIQIYYTWKWECDEHLLHTHIKWVATGECLTQSDWDKSRICVRGYYCNLPNFVYWLSVVPEI